MSSRSTVFYIKIFLLGYVKRYDFSKAIIIQKVSFLYRWKHLDIVLVLMINDNIKLLWLMCHRNKASLVTIIKYD